MDNFNSYCPAHPEREFPPNFKFCDVCGQPLIAQPATSEHSSEAMAEEPFSGTCPQCATPYRQGWKFCKTCGASLPDITPSTIKAGETRKNVETEAVMVAQVNRCPQCQTLAKEGMRFCQVCGHQLIEDSQPVAPKRQIEIPAVGGKPCRRCGAPTQAGLKFCQACGAPMTHIRRKWMVPAVSLMVGVILAIAGWYLYRNYQEQPSQDITQVVTPPTPEKEQPPGGTPPPIIQRDSQLADLTLVSVPSGCQVFVDGQPKQRTNVSGPLTIRGLSKGIAHERSLATKDENRAAEEHRRPRQ